MLHDSLPRNALTAWTVSILYIYIVSLSREHIYRWQLALCGVQAWQFVF